MAYRNTHLCCVCCHIPRPPAAGGSEKEDPGIHSIQLHPLHPEQIFVSNQSSSLYLMNMSGQVIKAMQSGKREGGGAGMGLLFCCWLGGLVGFAQLLGIVTFEQLCL
jgi:hypothetical protein